MARLVGKRLKGPSPPHSCLNDLTACICRPMVSHRTSSPTPSIEPTWQACWRGVQWHLPIAAGPVCWCYRTALRSRGPQDSSESASEGASSQARCEVLQEASCVLMTLAEGYEWRNPRFGKRPQRQARHELVHMARRLGLCNEAQRDPSCYRTAGHNPLVLDQLFGPRERWKDHLLDEGTSLLRCQLRTGLDVIEF